MLSDAKGEVIRGLEVVEFACGIPLTVVNDHEFGNGAALFTRDGDTAQAFLSRVRVGMVGVNVPIPVPWRSTPLVGGSARCSAIITSMVLRGLASRLVSRLRLCAGRKAYEPARSLSCRR